MESIRLHQVIDAKGDIGDCQPEVIFSVKTMDAAEPNAPPT